MWFLSIISGPVKYLRTVFYCYGELTSICFCASCQTQFNCGQTHWLEMVTTIASPSPALRSPAHLSSSRRLAPTTRASCITEVKVDTTSKWNHLLSISDFRRRSALISGGLARKGTSIMASSVSMQNTEEMEGHAGGTVRIKIHYSR